MTSRETYRTASRTIVIEQGSEGSRHDPYGYVKYSIHRRGWVTITLHVGLGTFLYYGKTNATCELGLTEEQAFRMFEKRLGCSMQAFSRAMHHCHARCSKCGTRAAREEEGYPGESFVICENGHVMRSHFDDSSII